MTETQEGIVLGPAAVVSAPATRHQYWIQHEQNLLVSCQPKDAEISSVEEFYLLG
jgi:hypothetical protein